MEKARILTGVDKRRQILEAAERVFRAKGLAGATTREIARDAGCAEGTIYLHFEDRMALFGAVLDECLPDVKESFYQLESLVGRRTVRQNLEGVAVRYFTFQQRAQGILCSVLAEPGLMKVYRERMREQNRGPQIGVSLLADYLGAEQKIGRVHRRISPEVTASMILGACFHKVFVSLYMDTPITQEVDVFVRDVIEGTLRGIRSSPVTRQAESADSFMQIRALHS